jgi:enoyl-CoA hydratase/carnithine racemase
MLARNMFESVVSFITMRKNSMNSQQNSGAIVTDASSGIGRGITLGRDPGPETKMCEIPSNQADPSRTALAILLASDFRPSPSEYLWSETVPQLNEMITALETDEHVKVVVFDSAVEGFFLTHYNFLAKLEDSTSLPPGPTGLQALPDMLARLSRAPVVSIASIRGRATGVGSELSLASDMRFASREKAILSQWEVGAGLVPGGGPMARLPRLIGRGRALEVLLGADDIPGDVAELYGYVNRALPDAELDAFVEALAVRIASFDKQAIAETKRLVNVASLPSDAEIAPEWDAFMASLGRPASQARIKALMEHGFHKAGDVENRLGYYVGQLGR